MQYLLNQDARPPLKYDLLALFWQPAQRFSVHFGEGFLLVWAGVLEGGQAPPISLPLRSTSYYLPKKDIPFLLQRARAFASYCGERSRSPAEFIGFCLRRFEARVDCFSWGQ